MSGHRGATGRGLGGFRNTHGLGISQTPSLGARLWIAQARAEGMQLVLILA